MEDINSIEDIWFKFLFNGKSEEPNWTYDICELEKHSLQNTPNDMTKFSVKSKVNNEIWDMKIKYIDGNLFILSEYIDDENLQFNKLNSFINNDDYEIIYYGRFKFGEIYLHIEYN